MTSNNNKSGFWEFWTGLPGVITAISALITALAVARIVARSVPKGFLTTSLIIGVAAAVITALLFLGLTKRRVRDLTVTFSEQLRRDRVGALLCDYVDIGTLQTLANQYSVPVQPEEIEKKTGRKRSATGELGITPGKLGGSDEASEELRLLYRVKFEPHVLTEHVIDAIAARDQIRTDLAEVPAFGLGELLKQIIETDQTVSAQTLLEALKVGKANQLKNVGEGGDFVLVEGLWHVTHERDHALLSLAQLVSGDTSLSMPDGVGLRVRTPVRAAGPEDLITAQGRQRLEDGAQIRATVFGRPAYYDDPASTLFLSPIAVYSRVGHVVT